MPMYVLTAANMPVEARQLTADNGEAILSWINAEYANKLRYPTLTDADIAAIPTDEEGWEDRVAALAAPSPMEMAAFDGAALIVPNVNDAAQPWRAELGDWVVRSKVGKFYTVKPAEFDAQFASV